MEENEDYAEKARNIFNLINKIWKNKKVPQIYHNITHS